MPLSVADALPRLRAVCVDGLTHPDYTRTVTLATLYRQLATGDIATLMRPMARRESPEEFASRVAFTIETVSASWAQLRTPFYTVARLRGGSVTRRFDYAETIARPEATRRAARLEGVVSQYYERRPLESYLAERLSKGPCMTDPNSWLLTEYGQFDYRTQVAQPYPVLVPCESAVDFQRQGGVVVQFTARFSIAQSATQYRYVCYLNNEAIDCWPVLYDGETPLPTIPGGPDAATGAFIQQDAEGNDTTKVLYHYRVLTPTGAGQVPAKVNGYVVDEEGTGETFVSPLHQAVPFLKQMLKVGSENDIVMSQMAFPVRVAYARDCPGTGKDAAGNIHQCLDGIDSETMGTCSRCGGLGSLAVPITAAETYTIPLPKIGENIGVKPIDTLGFVGPPTDNPKLQLDYLQSRRLLAMQAVHGIEDAERVAGSKTATQIQIQQQAQLTALAPFSDWFCSAYEYHAYTSAGYTDTQQGLTVVYEQPGDLEIVSEADLYVLRQAAVVAGASASTLEALDARIAYKQFADDEAALVKDKVRRRFVTFLGQTESWVTQQAQLGYISPADRVARTHADIIFGDLEAKYPAFYSMADAAQSELVQAAIESILAKLPASTGTGTFKAMTFPSPTVAAATPAVQVAAAVAGGAE